ncbi:MAG: hypothetical protein IKC58_00040 [Clostridia bacterium]|nr:hypothetical protein [Clostridia bacterium]MBR2984977.1 hypothetical protein [Clostridia bacterium]
MKKTKLIIAVLLAVMMVTSVVLTACQQPHVCTNVCPICGKCTNESCTEEACAEKCEGHSAAHTCESKCPTCGGCLDFACTDPACATKCSCEVNKLEYAEGTVLRIAAGYQKTTEAISFKDPKTMTDAGAVDGVLTLADGKGYKLGDLKPTWVQVSEDLGIIFEDLFTGAGSATKEFNYWKDAERLGEVDIIAGGADVIQESGAAGQLINLAEYLQYMPNFYAYLQENPVVRLSVTADVTTGAIYMSPYFDGVDDIERFPLIRADMVTKLLDGDKAFEGANRAVNTSAYKPYITENYSIESLTADGKGTQTITKDFSKAQNIVAQMNAATNLTGDQAVAMFRAYIDDMYGDVYENRSDLFLGYNAAWDADELVALLRCAVASLNDVNNEPIKGLFARESSNQQRAVDLYRFAGSLFGVRGMESRKDFLYFDSEGKLHSSRSEEATWVALERMNALVQEGLVDINTGKDHTSANFLANDAGIVSYDYCQTQTVMNATKLQEGEKYTAMMVPVAKWYDGSNANGVYMRFTESWRSVKTDGWAISKAGVSNADGSINEDKLNAALTLIDFAFSVQGQITMSYGSDDFIKVKNADVEVKTWEDVALKYETFNFNGKQMPVVSDAMYEELQELTGGNYTNYARWFLGSTLNGFPKSQAFEYQCTHEVGKEGAGKVSAAIALGTIKHPVLGIAENMWYTSIPTSLPFTTADNETLKEYSNLTTYFKTDKNSWSNLMLFFIENGYETPLLLEDSISTPAGIANLVGDTWQDKLYLKVQQEAWDRLAAYYANIAK